MAYQVSGSRVEWNPTAARLRELTEEMPNASVTEFGNVNVKARVDSRSTRSTYLVDDSTNSRGQTITRAEYDRVTAIQDAHIATSHMVVVDGYIGSDPQFRTPARLIMEAANANVAGMQQQLYYPAGPGYDPAAWEPDTTVIYTPNVEAPGYPDDRLIAVDLNGNITRVLNSDYFGESKKGGLRMWNNIVYNRGGLALHASAIVQGIVEGTIEWIQDPDFGYEVAAAVPGVDDIDLLQPRRLYERQGRMDEHEAMVARLKQERKEFLGSFHGLDESLVSSLG